MIRKFFVTMLCILPLLAGAQTIHWLTFIDTTDPNVGTIDQKGRDVLYSHFVNVINSALTNKGYKTNIRDIYGYELTPQKCKEIVSNFKCEPNDIVMFYYIGHGTHGTTGGDNWPMMFMAQDNPDYLIPLKWVHDQLKSKGGRLTATIAMCCNVYQGFRRLNAPAFCLNYGNLSLTDTEINAISKMFLENKGDVLISSASPGQSSYGSNPDDERTFTPFGPMDYFTAITAKIFEDSASEGNLDWNQLFAEVKETVNEFTEGYQTPFYAFNLSKASLPSIPKPTTTPVIVQTPKPASAPTTTTAPAAQPSNQDLLNNLSSALDNLINVQQKESARISQASELEKAFTTNAIVKVISQDGDIVVDKSSADDFIGRLATSRIILKVTPVSVTLKGDKISELRVKETYKK